VQHYPGIHPDAAMLLVEERDIVGVGVDTLSQDFGASTDFATHVTILGAGKYGVEGIANLGNVPPTGATVIVGGPKHVAASGGPSRLFALY
jgi:kynurenine formamidase